MFKKLKDKLKNWSKKLTEKVEEVDESLEENFEKEIEQKETSIETLEIKETLENSKKEKTLPDKIDEIIQGKYKEPKIEEIEIEEIEKPKEKKSFFKRITSKITKIKISEKDFDIYSDELEMLLLENNVALEVAEKIIIELKKKIIEKEIPKKEVEKEIQDTFKEIIKEILIEPFNIIEKIKNKENKKPYVILFCGINGTGKTTTIAKIAQQLKNNDLTCVLAAGDTFRAASIEQLKKHGENLNVEVIAHEYNSDPASVGFDAIKYAEKNNLDCVLIDTAGRMHTSKNLMAQIEKITKVTKPNLKIFIGESITGNDVIEQIKNFDSSIGIDGIILTKADIDEKGGTALSTGYITKKPILYLGTGQEMDAIISFNKEDFIKKLGLGD